ncbi:MAG: spherulation-specific family 4 protein [Anaerolineae bacterium]
MAARNFYVIYYGWLIRDAAGNPSEAAEAIAAARPAALLAMFHTFSPRYPNLSVQVRELLHAAGMRLFPYVDTDYGDRPLEQVVAEAVEYLDAGVDGIFFDRAYNFLDDGRGAYYQQLYEVVAGCGKTVVVNTGVAQCGEAIMDCTDILMVEHDWRRLYHDDTWHAAYPAERFMGNSSNEPDADKFLGYRVDSERAVQDTHEAWSNGVGWHTSTDRYVELPVWFPTYVRNLDHAIS